MGKALSDYKVTFRRKWHWTATTPDGEVLKGPLLGVCVAKETAERDAARRIELHAAKETVDGDTLVRRVPAGT